MESIPNYLSFPAPTLDFGHVLRVQALRCFAVISLPSSSIGWEAPEFRAPVQSVVSSSFSMGPGAEGHSETLYGAEMTRTK